MIIPKHIRFFLILTRLKLIFLLKIINTIIGINNNINIIIFFNRAPAIILVKSSAWLASAIVWKENGTENKL